MFLKLFSNTTYFSILKIATMAGLRESARNLTNSAGVNLNMFLALPANSVSPSSEKERASTPKAQEAIVSMLRNRKQSVLAEMKQIKGNYLIFPNFFLSSKAAPPSASLCRLSMSF